MPSLRGAFSGPMVWVVGLKWQDWYRPGMTIAPERLPGEMEMAVRHEKCRHHRHKLHAIVRWDSGPETGAGTW